MTMPPNLENRRLITRRHFFGRTATGIGTAALASLLGKDMSAAARGDSLERPFPGLPTLPHFAPKAKRVIWLFQSGGPSQMDLFDYKPQLDKWRGEDLPDSIRKGQRLTGMTSTQDSFPVVNSVFKFNRQGQSGAWISEILPRPRKWSMISASSSRCTPRRSTTTRRSRLSKQAPRSRDVRASEPGWPTAWAVRVGICQPLL